MRVFADKDHQTLIHLLDPIPGKPEGLEFWLCHMSAEAKVIWQECPRMEWLLWIAQVAGIAGARCANLRYSIELELEDERKQRDKRLKLKSGVNLAREESPRQEYEAAARVRDKITFKEIIDAPAFKRAGAELEAARLAAQARVA